MITKRMVLEGDYVEAFLYFDFLWLFDNDGGVYAFDLETYIEKELNGSGSAARKLFARNDEMVKLSGRPYGSLQTPDVQNLVASDAPIVVSVQDVLKYSIFVDAGTVLNRPLDVRMYNGHAFVSVPGGLALFEAFGREDTSSVSMGSARSGMKTKAERVFDSGTPLQIQCRLGALSLSCGGEGLYGGVGALTQGWWRPELNRVADVSFGCEVARAGISSIPEAAGLELRSVETVVVPATSGRRRKDEAVEPVAIMKIAANVDEEASRQFEEIIATASTSNVLAEQTFLSTTSAYTSFSDGRMVRTALTKQNAFGHARWDGVWFPAPEGEVIAMTTTAGKMIAETHEDVQILDQEKWVRLFGEPVLRVRGYPNSKWYRQLVTIVGEGQAELVFLCDD
ncbi:hypothetical protein [Sphingomonas sp. R86521]|uniref:hypothetical protein n=1 Tax=Sphingomonas sp. R86521 TaxID=3093860 RepID=UPI0036D36466